MISTLHTDGGARGNPGPAGIGYVLVITEEKTIESGEYIGEATNNQAEYRALIAGLKRATKEKVDQLHCYLDSELVVRQLNGEYKIKNADLQPLAQQVRELATSFAVISYNHVPREKNKAADKLVNRAIDTHKKSA